MRVKATQIVVNKHLLQANQNIKQRTKLRKQKCAQTERKINLLTEKINRAAQCSAQRKQNYIYTAFVSIFGYAKIFRLGSSGNCKSVIGLTIDSFIPYILENVSLTHLNLMSVAKYQSKINFFFFKKYCLLLFGKGIFI